MFMCILFARYILSRHSFSHNFLKCTYNDFFSHCIFLLALERRLKYKQPSVQYSRSRQDGKSSEIKFSTRRGRQIDESRVLVRILGCTNFTSASRPSSSRRRILTSLLTQQRQPDHDDEDGDDKILFHLRHALYCLKRRLLTSTITWFPSPCEVM